MYKSHMHSAIGRGRPLAHEVSRGADVITAGLRAFSSSVARNAEENDSKSSRADRSSAAVSDISSLPSRPTRGIDARSLAAKPSPNQSFVVRRVQLETRAGRGRGGSFNTGARGRGGASFRGRQPAGTGFRAGNASFENLGGTSGRGRGRGRGSGRSAGARKPQEGEPDEYDPPYTKEEQDYITSQESGDYVPYNPTTSLEELQTMFSGMPTSTSNWGQKEVILYRMQVASGTLGNKEIPTPPEKHIKNIEGPDGVGTVFASKEEKETLRAWMDKEKEEISNIAWRFHERYEIEGLRKEEKEALLKEMVAGVYQSPKDVTDGILGQVKRYARKNETFLPESERSLEDKLKILLPTG